MRDGDSLSYRKCMANYLRNNMWLTARHCVSPDGSTNGFVQVGDDSKYALQNVYIPNEGVDLALVETSPVGELQGFELPSRRLNLGEIAYLAQYNRDYPYFESVPVTVTKYLDDHSFPIAEGKSETVRYSGLYEAESVTDSQPCIGDSGGAIFVGKSIYAIHTGGGESSGSFKTKMKSKMWFSDVYPNIEWINFTVDSGGKSMIQEEKNGVGHDTAKLPAAGGQLSSLLANLSSSSLVVSEPSRG